MDGVDYGGVTVTLNLYEPGYQEEMTYHIDVNTDGDEDGDDDNDLTLELVYCAIVRL